jgi:hypothetical protein
MLVGANGRAELPKLRAFRQVFQQSIAVVKRKDTFREVEKNWLTRRLNVDMDLLRGWLLDERRGLRVVVLECNPGRRGERRKDEAVLFLGGHPDDHDRT